MTTYVLVGGFWIGAWAWLPLVTRLVAQGHRAIALDLTGLGEEADLGGPDVTLETHISDVIAAIRMEDLRNVVLVGHSGAGAIVNCVADRIPERIAGLVFVDTGPVPEGFSIADFAGPEGRADMEKQALDGWRIPLPPWEAFREAELAGLDEKKRTAFRKNAADEPLHVAIDPVMLTGGMRPDLKKWAILCSIPVDAVRGMIAEGNPWFAPMGGPEWALVELPTSHWPMMTEPNKLADMLAAWPAVTRFNFRKAS